MSEILSADVPPPPDYAWVAAQFTEAYGAIDNSPVARGILPVTTDHVKATLERQVTYDRLNSMLFQSALHAAQQTQKANEALIRGEPPVDTRVALMAHYALFSYAEERYPEAVQAGGDLHVAIFDAFQRVAADIVKRD